MECNLTKNLKECTCTYEPCSRKGKCCECVRYHQRQGELPGCFFPPDWEKTFDRSVENFLRAYKR
uniref:Cytosolic protein n=1 Tax=candidate division WOR-3 bacterium TaxID=2052148 RepID=A0A7C3YVA3_UNCW3